MFLPKFSDISDVPEHHVPIARCGAGPIRVRNPCRVKKKLALSQIQWKNIYLFCKDNRVQIRMRKMQLDENLGNGTENRLET
jgi:hypothetical protein